MKTSHSILVLLSLVVVGCELASTNTAVVGEIVSSHPSPLGLEVATTSNSLTFKLTKQNGSAIANQPLFFQLDHVAGEVVPSEGLTSDSGDVSIQLKAGPSIGQGELTVHSLIGEPMILKIQLYASQATELNLDGPSIIETEESTPIHAQLKDQFANPIEGAAITFTSANPKLVLQENTLFTNNKGVVINTVNTSLSEPGSYSIVIEHGSLKNVWPVTLAAKPPSLVAFDLDQPIGNTLCGGSIAQSTSAAAPLWLTVSDPFGNPVPEQVIHFTPLGDGVSVDPTYDITDGQGRASTLVNTLQTSITLNSGVIGSLNGSTLETICAFTILP